MSDLVVLQRLLLITVIAGAIGYERERHGRAAGFRTHILVGVGACLVMLTGMHLAETLGGRVPFDPTRMAAQVISGIGFLGAGTILRFRASVRGLTTAASLWAVGGVGLAVGAGFLHGAVLAGLIVMVVMFGFTRLERAMRRDWYQLLVIETGAAGAARHLARVRALLAEHDIEIRDLDIKEDEPTGRVRLEFQVKLLPDQPRDEIVSQLLRLEGTMGAYWA
ncbi:MAG: MgtC/SapB family protein [Candidatus Omnitrophica bacterium]|nr:MgtC/SapB family protein [Candidatus Omnitrophota bacterium]